MRRSPAAGSGRSSSAPTTAARPGSRSGNKFALRRASPGTHQWYDGTQHPWEFKRVWHLEPSLTDPDTVYAGVEDAALFRTTDGGQTWQELSGPARHAKGTVWQPGAGGMCLHTILLDPSNPEPHLHRHLGGGRVPHRRRRRDLAADQPRPEVASTISRSGRRGRPLRPPHRHASVAAGRALHAEALGRHAQRRRRRSWHEVSGNLPTDFGFPIDVHAHEPETIYVVPIKSDSEHYPPDGKLRVYRSRTGGNEWEALTNGLPQSDCYVNVLRDAMAVDSLDSCGVYFGTTGGQVYASADGGDTWAPIVRDLPAVLSVEVQTLPMIRVDASRIICGRWRASAARWSSRSKGRSRSARSSTRSRRAIRCCAARSATTSRRSAGRSCASSPASRICRTNRRIPVARRGRAGRGTLSDRRGDGRRLRGGRNLDRRVDSQESWFDL